jgi:sulfur carrier protein
MKTIYINGTARPIGEAKNVEALLKSLGVTSRKIALEHNGEILRAATWAATPVAEGDRIEIIQFVGGG